MNIFLKISLLTSFTIATISANATGTIDSLPSCIVRMKKNDSLITIVEYNYKAQRWFVIEKKITKPEKNYPDKMTTTKFYNDNCQLVCTWVKGGIAGLNKVVPDTIEKDKIKVLNILTLPDTIQKLGIQKNIKEIQEFSYNGKTLYRILNNTLPAYELAKKGIATIDEPYYDEKGKIVAIFKRATTGTFLRAQQWQPTSFKPTLLVKTINKWTRKNSGYLLQ